MLYRLIIKLRNRAYDSGRRKSFRSPVPAVCIGNVAVGGTGKTPHTELLLRLLSEDGSARDQSLPAVLSRGYRRKSKGFQFVQTDSPSSLAGDEPLQIKRKFPQLTVAVDADRVNGCARLAEAGAGTVILDDAFQYRRLKADLNIVLIEFSRPPRKDRFLPWGRLRDLPGRINDADIIIVTKCPFEPDESSRRAYIRELQLTRDIPVLFSHMEYLPMQPVFPEADKHFLYSPEALLLSGIASDLAFRKYVGGNYRIRGAMRFDDHHNYTARDIGRLAALSEANPRAIAVTTEKDAQKIRDLAQVPESLRQRLFYLPIQAALFTEEDLETLRAALKRLSQRRG